MEIPKFVTQEQEQHVVVYYIGYISNKYNVLSHIMNTLWFENTLCRAKHFFNTPSTEAVFLPLPHLITLWRAENFLNTTSTEALFLSFFPCHVLSHFSDQNISWIPPRQKQSFFPYHVLSRCGLKMLRRYYNSCVTFMNETDCYANKAFISKTRHSVLYCTVLSLACNHLKME